MTFSVISGASSPPKPRNGADQDKSCNSISTTPTIAQLVEVTTATGRSAMPISPRRRGSVVA
jgi:hypothetical protein